MEFSYSLSVNNNIVLCQLKGRLMDKEQAAPMLAEIDRQVAENNNKIILDLSGVDYMNSSGLNILVNILTKARSKNGEVVICNLSAKVKELFIITKLNTLFHVSDDLAAAETMLKK